MDLSELRAGAAAVAPMVVGVVPFGLVAGATPVAGGLGVDAAVGFSTVVFAGASQLAAIDVLAGGGSGLVAVLAAWTINLRMLLYSASLAPYLAEERLWRRLGGAYLLVDQVYAVSAVRWAGDGEPRRRLPFLVGAGLLLWVVWQAATVTGALLGSVLPDRLPLDFAVPLVFLALLVPMVNSAPAAAAAGTGGIGAVLAAQAGAGSMSIMVGAVTGIVAGTLTEAARQRPALPPENP